MALIKCPECGKEVSDKAAGCPNCGFPIAQTVRVNAEKLIRTIEKEKTIKIENEISKYDLSKDTPDAALISYADSMSNNIGIDNEAAFKLLLDRVNKLRAEEVEKLDNIILDTHNEYRKHSANWGKGKELKAICERTGMDMSEAKKALKRFEPDRNIVRAARAQAFAENMGVASAQLHSYQEKQEEKRIARCPKCKSTSITYDTKKLSVGRALVGDAVAGPVGAVIGGLSSKKGYCVCMNCGKRWKI